MEFTKVCWSAARPLVLSLQQRLTRGLTTDELVDRRNIIWVGSAPRHVLRQLSKKFKKIKVELVGKGEVHWTEQRSDQNGVQTINYVNNEDYVEYEVNVHQVEKSYVK